MSSNLSDAGRAWENNSLNAHLDDWDISNARDLAIEARAEELLTKDGPDGYAPFGEQMAALFAENIDLQDVLRDVVPSLVEGHYAVVGEILAQRMREFARAEALTWAAILVDKEHNEPTGAQLDAYDDRERGE